MNINQLELLFQWQTQTNPTAYLLACSGGRDSIALLHALYQQKTQLSAPLEIVYINHGWHKDAAKWGELVATHAAAYGFSFRSVSLHLKATKNAEAVARKARYQAFAQLLPANGVLLTAHHQDDQAETLLLNLCRGSGLDGLSAMPLRRSFAAGEHWRPWLLHARAEIEDYLKSQQLTFVDDSSNTDTRYQRNWLRHQVLPLLETRFPAIRAQLAQTSAQLSDARHFQEHCLHAYLPAPEQPFTMETLSAVPSSSRALLIRYWLRQRHLPLPPRRRLQEFIDQLDNAEHAQIEYADRRLFRYRSEIYNVATEPPAPPPTFAEQTHWHGIGTLTLQSGAALLSSHICRWTLYPPAARFRPHHQAHHKPLKAWFQQYGVPPFFRRRTPLLWADDALIWVGGIGAASGWETLVIDWQRF